MDCFHFYFSDFLNASRFEFSNVKTSKFTLRTQIDAVFIKSFSNTWLGVVSCAVNGCSSGVRSKQGRSNLAGVTMLEVFYGHVELHVRLSTHHNHPDFIRLPIYLPHLAHISATFFFFPRNVFMILIFLFLFFYFTILFSNFHI